MKTKIQELYENPKSKGFVNHLIRAYLPMYKVLKLWEFKKEQKHVCNVCGQKLFDIEEAFKAISENKESITKDLTESLSKMAKGETQKRKDNPYVKAIGVDKVQAFTGEKTDTCLCMQCVQDLLDLTQTGFAMGDKNISYHINQMQRDKVFEQFTKNPALNEEEKDKVKEIKKRVDKKRKVTTFGDLEILQKIKEKMEKEKSS